MAISIQSVMHVNVNCSDLEKSIAFYCEAVGLERGAHTNPPPQKGFPMGEGGAPGQVQWDAWILQDARGFAGPGLDLLRWRLPEPEGHPYAEPNHLGLTRLGISVPDVDAAHGRVTRLGYRCLSEPGVVPVDDDLSARIFSTLDPDGSLVEFVEIPATDGPRLLYAEIGCRELARSVDWYQQVLGLEVHGRCAPGPQQGSLHGLEGQVEWQVCYLRPPGTDAFGIDLLQWIRPGPVGRPYPTANHLGLYRLAFRVEDIRACHEELRRQKVECPEPVFLDMGPEIPIDGVWAVFFPDPDGTCLELIESPKPTARA